MRRSLLALLLCGACWAATAAQARVWSGVDLMHVESADGTNMCALTFDDGPAGHTERLLEVLEAEGIHATFFMLGRQVLAHPALVQRIAQTGHDIGIHSQTHPNMKKLSMDKQAEELLRPLLALQELGIAPHWFRPPYGNMNAPLKELAAYLGLSIVIWSHDSKDWKRTRSDYANMETATGAPTPEGAMRGVFLFHDTSARTAEELPDIINILRARGCQRFVTMREFTGETERPLPSRQDATLFAQAEQSLSTALNKLKQEVPGAGVELLSATVAAVTHQKPLPDFAAAGLRTPPFTDATAVAAASGVAPSAPAPLAGQGSAPVSAARVGQASAPSTATATAFAVQPATPAAEAMGAVPAAAAATAAAPAAGATAAVPAVAPSGRRGLPAVFRFAPLPHTTSVTAAAAAPAPVGTAPAATSTVVPPVTSGGGAASAPVPPAPAVPSPAVAASAPVTPAAPVPSPAASAAAPVVAPAPGAEAASAVPAASAAAVASSGAAAPSGAAASSSAAVAPRVGTAVPSARDFPVNAPARSTAAASTPAASAAYGTPSASSTGGSAGGASTAGASSASSPSVAASTAGAAGLPAATTAAAPQLLASPVMPPAQ